MSLEIALPLTNRSDQPLAIRLESEHCALRPAQIADLPRLVNAISHAEFPAALPLSDFYRDGQLSAWLDRMCQKSTNPDSAVWAIDLLSGESSIGQVSVIARAQDHVLSFWLAPPHWGKGLAREAVSKALGHAFATGKVKRALAATAVLNTQSAKLMLSLGFTEGQILEAGYPANGITHAVRQFSLHSHQEVRSVSAVA